MHRQNCSVTKGDIVWARVQFPSQFWPSLVLCTDSLGVCVSSFNHNLSPRYVIESEVVPFEENFRWIMGHEGVKKCETFYALLDSALKLMGQRVISSLKCRCQLKPQRNDDGNGGGGGNDGGERFDGLKSNTCFQPNRVLGFVLRVAALPWVDESDFVDAVRAVAQVQAFRSYCSIEQKRFYENTQEGNDVKLLHSSSLGKEMYSVSEASVALQPQLECQILSKQGGKTLTIGSIKSLNSKIPLVKENVKPLYENRLQIIPQTNTRNRKVEFLPEMSLHLCSLTFDPFCMVRLLRYKNISEQNNADPCLKDCSKFSEVFGRRKDTAIELYYRLPDMKTTAYLTKKRKQLDHPVLCDCSIKLQKLSSLSSTNEASSSLKIIKSGNKEDDHDDDVFVLPSTFADCFRSYRMEMDSYHASFLQSPVKPSDLGLRAIHIGGCSWMNFPNNASCCMSFWEDTPCHVALPPEKRDQEAEGNDHISKYLSPWVSQTKMFEPDRSIQKQNQSRICFHGPAAKFAEEVNLESPSNFVLGAPNSNNYEVEVKETSKKGLKRSDSTHDKKRVQISKSNTSTRIKLSSSCRLKKNENFNQADTSCTDINSKIGKQLTQVSHDCSKCLHMIFPRNFNLPSKSELIKKFRVCGPIDHPKTKVFSLASSAQVAFLRAADAATAYLYAKRKKVSFGSANVRFWLDAFEHKRGGSSKCRAPMSSSANERPTPLKSCLKSSSSQKKDNRKKPYKVRFTIVT